MSWLSLPRKQTQRFLYNLWGRGALLSGAMPVKERRKLNWAKVEIKLWCRWNWDFIWSHKKLWSWNFFLEGPWSLYFNQTIQRTRGIILGRTAPFSGQFTEECSWGSSTASTACTWRCGGTLLIHYNDVLSYILSYIISVMWKLFISRLRMGSR